LIKVQQAQFRRVLERGGHSFAEVEVITDNPQRSQLLAYFRNGPNSTYTLTRLLTNDADREVDWFDNSLHSAFEDVTAPMLSSPDHLANDDRDEFVAQILSCDGIEESLDRELNPNNIKS
jgi:hypothetical protein